MHAGYEARVAMLIQTEYSMYHTQPFGNFWVKEKVKRNEEYKEGI